jgi:HSP20 family protein
MALVRFEPFRELTSFQNEVARVFDQVWGTPVDTAAKAGAWAPPLDVWETDDEIVLALDLPGVTKDQISVELDGRQLTITGERAAESREESDRYYRVERRFGAFARSVTLPKGVHEAGINADFRDGVLEIHVPKPEEQKPRRIEVGAAHPDVDAA